MCSLDCGVQRPAPHASARRSARRAAIAGCGVLLLAALVPRAYGQTEETEDRSDFLGIELLEPWQIGFGFDLFLASADDLETTALETVTFLCDGAGNCGPGVIPSDPELLNRKFGFELEETVPGLQVPLGLPPLRLGGGRSLRSALVLEVASSDLRLDFRDRTRSGDSTALEGRGTRFGLGLEAAAPLCDGCRFFAAAGYRYRRLPGREVDRRGEVAPGFPVLDDRVVLEQEQHLASARLGYAAGRFAPYLGVRARRGEIEIEDELRFTGPDGSETALTTRTTLESDAVDGVAGLDVRIGPRLLGRIEAALGEGAEGALLKLVVRLGPGAPDLDPPPEKVRRAEEIRAAVTPRLRPIEAGFDTGRAALREVVGPAGTPAYLVADVVALLDRTEDALLAALEPEELAPLRAWVSDRFDRIRDELASAAVTAAGSPGTPGPRLAGGGHGASRVLPAAKRPGSGEQVASASTVVGLLESVRGVVEQVRRLFETGRGLTVGPVCIVTDPKGAMFTMFPPRYRQTSSSHQIHETNAPVSLIYRGLYAYEVRYADGSLVDSVALGFSNLDFVLFSDTQDSKTTILCRKPKGCDPPRALDRDLCQENP